ncbi:MAG TPA: ABC-three component system protein [Abditibacteriaceae bacterium]|jgi:hypothetical protein
MSDQFSAGASALGYFYQVRYSLWLLLGADDTYDISIESLDDIAFHESGTPVELLQAKHSIESTASLTDYSSEIWKTLRVWITRFNANEIVLDNVVLSLISTAEASEGSAAAKLRPEPVKDRDVDGALILLTQVATTSARAATSSEAKGMAAFLALSLEDRKALLSRIHVLDSSPNIIDAQDKILKSLRISTRPEFLNAVYERLEGWWFNLVVLHLADKSAQLIPYRALLSQINDIQEQFHQDALPIDFLDAITPKIEDLSANERAFVEQLRLVLVTEPRIQKAVNDYYRAFKQRSQWVREEIINISELEKYERRLMDEWDRLHLMMKEDIGDIDDDHIVARAGRDLYNSIERMTGLDIRPRVTEPYVMRGSFHILSNQFRVGWHKDFLGRLEHLLSASEESAA